MCGVSSSISRPSFVVHFFGADVCTNAQKLNLHVHHRASNNAKHGQSQFYQMLIQILMTTFVARSATGLLFLCICQSVSLSVCPCVHTTTFE